MQNHSKLSHLFLKENYLGSEAQSWLTRFYYQCNAGQVSRTEIPSKREKTVSPEVDTLLFTNSFCSAMKEIDPALLLIHKLPLMKLLELLKGGTDELGLVTIVPH